MKPSKELERVTKTAKVMLIVAFLCTFCIVGTRISQASWTPPSGAAPGGNTSAPLNVSSAYQTKQGSLNISGDKLMVSAGSMLFGSVSTDDRGIFWADTAEAEYPHVNYKSGQLFLSPGDTGTSTEIQGDLKIARLGPGLGTQGSITIDNPFNSQQLVLKVDDGANGAKINTVGSALNINTVGGRLFLNTSGTEAVHIGSTAEKAMICLNSVSDAILGDECIDEWSDIGSGGGYWSLTDNVIDPDVVYTTDLNHTVAIGRNNYFAEATALTVQSRGQDAFGIELVESDANNRIFSVKESATGHGELYLYNNAGNNTIVLDSSGGSYFAGNVGFGDWSPTSQLTVGNGDKFRVDSSGNVIRINDIAYSWPAVQGLANSYLRNDGSGNLSWVLGAGGGTDELVMVSAGETAGYLNDELVAGTDISLVEEDGGGGDMRMVVNYTGAGGGSGLWEGGSGTSINPVDPTGTLVGVGTNTPVSMFHVYGNNSWGSDISIDAQNVANGRRWMMISTGGDAGEGQGKFLIKDNVAGANRMVFDTTGKVGIGTDSPAEELHVIGDAIISSLTNCTDGSTVDAWGGKLICGVDQGGAGGGIGGSGDVNYLAKFTASDAIGSSLIYQDPLNNNFGIGVDDPKNHLDIGWNFGGYMALRRDDGIISNGEDLGALYFTGDAGAAGAIGAEIKANTTADWSGNDYPTKLTFGTAPDGGTVQQRMVIGSDGKVGIGIASPVNNLDVGHPGGGYMALKRYDPTIVNTNDLGALYFTGNPGGANGTGAEIKAIATETWSDDDYPTKLTFGTAPNSGTVSERMVINQDGLIGIGTADPKTPLNLYNTTAGKILLQDAGSGSAVTDGFEVSQDGSTAYVLNRESGSLYLGTSGSYRLTIDSAGKVGIGTTSPSQTLHVVGDARVTGLNCTGNANGGKVTGDASGLLSCADDIGGGSSGITGSGSVNRIAMFTANDVIGNSNIYYNNTYIGIGGAPANDRLEVTGAVDSSDGYKVDNNEVIDGDGRYYYTRNTSVNKWGAANGSGFGIDALNSGDYDFLVYEDLTYTSSLRLGYQSGANNAVIDTYDANDSLTIRANGSGNINIMDNGTGDVNVDSGTLFVDNSANRIGLGTTNPSQALHVVGGARITGLNCTGNANGGKVTGDASGNLTCADDVDSVGEDSPWTLNVSNLYPDNTAWQVGVGTTDVRAKLHVVGSGTTDQLAIGRSATSSYFRLGTDNASNSYMASNATHNGSGGWTYINVGGYGGKASMISLTADLSFQTQEDVTEDPWTWDTKMRIKSSGNVGIGQLSPAGKFVVNHGLAGAGSAGDAIATYADSGNSALYAQQNSTSGYAGSFSGKGAISALQPVWDSKSTLRAINETASTNTGVGIIGVGGSAGSAGRGSYGVAGFGRNATGSGGRSVGVYGESNASYSSTGIRAGIMGNASADGSPASAKKSAGVYGVNSDPGGDDTNYGVYSEGDFGVNNNKWGGSPGAGGSATVSATCGTANGGSCECPDGSYMVGLNMVGGANNDFDIFCQLL